MPNPIIDVTKPEYVELKKALLEDIAKEAANELNQESLDKLMPKVELMMKTISQKHEFSMFAGEDKGKSSLSETTKAYSESARTAKHAANFTPEMTEIYANPGLLGNASKKIWSAEKAESMAGYLRTIWARKQGLGESLPTVLKAMGETVGSTGGFLPPIEFRPELLRLIIEDQLVRPNAFVVPMTSDTLWWPKIVDTSHVTVIHGGMKGTVNAESADLSSSETDPTFGLIQLIAKKFTDFKTVPNELIMDSPIAIMPLLGVLCREGLGFYEDVSAIWGNGSNTAMKGFMKSGSLISVTRAVASHISWADVLGMQSKLFPSSYKRAFWACSPSAIVDLGQMGIAVGTGGSGVWIANIPGQTAAQAMPMSILGRPLVISEKLQTLGTAGDLVLCDFSYYVIGDRMEMTIAASTERYFEKDQTGFRIVERVDGQPWIDSALTAYNGTDTLSAFVALS